MLAEEGLEAARNIRDENYVNLTDGTYGLSISNNKWAFTGTQDTTGAYTRRLTISTIDDSTKQVVCTVIWPGGKQVSLSTYLTDWRRLTPIVNNKKGGMLVYSDPAVITDKISYKVLNPLNGTWSIAQSTADIDAASTNKIPRVVQLYASSTRDEKVLVSRHFDGSSQFIYAQIFNGTAWGNVMPLTSWSSTTFLDVDNFSGTYLKNGDFMVVYSDNTKTPKFRIWNGTAWSGTLSLQSLTRAPNYITVKQRPDTNEVMAVFFLQNEDMYTQYFNGSTYATSAWDLHSKHTASTPSNDRKFVDFAWSGSNTLLGVLVYINGKTNSSFGGKVWSANSSGSGSWGSEVISGNQIDQVGSLSITNIPKTTQFLVCDEDTALAPNIVCYTVSTTPALTYSTPIVLGSNADVGTGRSYDAGFEQNSGELGLSVYSDGTTIPKYRAYKPNTGWSSSSSINTLSSNLKTALLRPNDNDNDIMIILTDTSRNLYTTAWDGTNNVIYAVPPKKSFVNHGNVGIAGDSLWYDFEWNGI